MPARTLAEIWARKSLVFAWLDQVGLLGDKGEPRPILRELPRWERNETRLFAEMALTLRSRVELDLDRLAVERGMIALEDYRQVESGWQDTILWVLEEARAGRVPADGDVLARLRRQLERATARDGGDVVEGSARQLEAGEREADGA
jgi:hypothetical protein